MEEKLPALCLTPWSREVCKGSSQTADNVRKGKFLFLTATSAATKFLLSWEESERMETSGPHPFFLKNDIHWDEM